MIKSFLPQFSIHSLMLAVAVASIGCGIQFGLEGQRQYYATLYVLLTLASLLCVGLASGNRTFRMYAAGTFPIIVFSTVFHPLGDPLFADSLPLSNAVSMLLIGLNGVAALALAKLLSHNADSDQRAVESDRVVRNFLVGLTLGFLVTGVLGLIHSSFHQRVPGISPDFPSGGVI